MRPSLRHKPMSCTVKSALPRFQTMISVVTATFGGVRRLMVSLNPNVMPPAITSMTGSTPRPSKSRLQSCAAKPSLSISSAPWGTLVLSSRGSKDNVHDLDEPTSITTGQVRWSLETVKMCPNLTRRATTELTSSGASPSLRITTVRLAVLPISTFPKS